MILSFELHLTIDEWHYKYLLLSFQELFRDHVIYLVNFKVQ